jgi:serine phosphatase RsbU (regulator of sigma subunit)
MRFIKILLVIVFTGTASSLYAQKQDLKSMINKVNQGTEDTIQVNLLITICDSLFRAKPEETLQYGSKALELSRKLNFRKGEAYALKYLGMAYFVHAEYEPSAHYFQDALEIFEKIKDRKGTANMLSNLGVILSNTGNDAKALEQYLKALDISEEINDSVRLVTVLINIGLVYSKSDVTVEKARDYYLRALQVSEKLDYQLAIGTVTVDLGELFLAKGDYKEALSYFERSLMAYKKAGAGNTSYTLINIGKIYALNKDYNNALKYQEEAYRIAMENNSKLEMGQALLGLANTYVKKGDSQNALKYFKQSEQITSEIGAKYERREAYEGMAKTYALNHDYTNAYLYKSMESTVKDSLFSEASQKSLNQIQFQLQYQSKTDSTQKENEFLKHSAKLKEAKSKTLRVAIVLLFLGFVCTSLFLIILARTIKQKKKANAELIEKNSLITLQKEAITDSIIYAKRIQTAILPPPDLITTTLPESLIVFRPRDIVSGDFYWLTKSCERIICIVADCTGHGVPGALMSMLGISFLNSIVNRNPGINAAEILGEMRKYVVKSLRQSYVNGESKDGMDVALLVFNEKMTRVEYAGANNPLIMVRNGELIEYKSDKMPIGIHLNVSQPFSSHEIAIQKGDMLYLFSDGYEDQFGGPLGKKFMIKNLKHLFVEIHAKEVEVQKQIIESRLTDWMGQLEQVDDILVMGIRV